MSIIQDIRKKIGQSMIADRFRFRQRLKTLENFLEPSLNTSASGAPSVQCSDNLSDNLSNKLSDTSSDSSNDDQSADKSSEKILKRRDEKLVQLLRDVEKSVETASKRNKNRPKIQYDDQLPVSGRRNEITEIIRKNQVVVICGETGSGKSTQIPKICLEMGRGIFGLIGHTQPRRIAARSVAARIAEELGTPLGQGVGYKIRFTDETGPETWIKLMTDGILLAESQNDRFFEQYDTIIIDEAHERSLNIDFLLGMMKRVLRQRRDLKLIITSATIDARRFAEHFSDIQGKPAPVLEISGRTYPIEILYRPLNPSDEDSSSMLMPKNPSLQLSDINNSSCSKPFSSDTAQNSSCSKPFSSDTAQNSSCSKPFSTDTAQGSSCSKPFSADTAQNSSCSKSFSADSAQNSSCSKPFSADTTQNSSCSKPFSADTAQDSSCSKPFSTDSAQNSSCSKPFSADTAQNSSCSKSFSTDSAQDSSQTEQLSPEINTETVFSRSERPLDKQDKDLYPFSLTQNSNFGKKNRSKQNPSSEEDDLETAVLNAVDELARRGRGDMLIFLPTERDIFEIVKALKNHSVPGDNGVGKTEILPLFARLPSSEQQKIFKTGKIRKIVVSTNVAESSLTVPGIRFVIDCGTARISRYSARSRTQRLPVESISQASADQRAGRCGRIGPGICLRLYSEKDYLSRDRYTTPEIQRTNLASVILQTKALKLGAVEHFPFIDPPKSLAINDGYKTLFELKALDENRDLTPLGRQLSRLPVDPRIGRMILAAADEHCLREVLIIASVLEIQDPRERPHDKQEKADEAHLKFVDEKSDFMTFLKIWDFYHSLRKTLSQSQLRKACLQNFLSFNRMKEWLDIYLQLLQLVRETKLPFNERKDDYDAIHRAILTGLLSGIANRQDSVEYTVAGNAKFFLWPGSGLFKNKSPWVVASERVETSKKYLRTVGKINVDWIEPLAEHLLKREYFEPFWSSETGFVQAFERVSLFGLPIIPRRRINYGPIDPKLSRELFIQCALVEQDFSCGLDFFKRNADLLEEAQQLQAKLRKYDFLLGQNALSEFYQARIPEFVYDRITLETWYKKLGKEDRRRLLLTLADVCKEDVDDSVKEQYPDQILTGAGTEMQIEYHFKPGDDEDGLTLIVPLEGLRQLQSAQLGWLVPGLLEQKISATLKTLPKEIRRRLVPIPDSAKKLMKTLAFGQGVFEETLAKEASQLAGCRILSSDFDLEKLSNDLLMNLRVIDSDGEILDSGREIESLRRDLGIKASTTIAAVDDPRWTQDNIKSWSFGTLPESIEIRRGGIVLKAFPMLADPRFLEDFLTKNNSSEYNCIQNETPSQNQQSKNLRSNSDSQNRTGKPEKANGLEKSEKQEKNGKTVKTPSALKTVEPPKITETTRTARTSKTSETSKVSSLFGKTLFGCSLPDQISLRTVESSRNIVSNSNSRNSARSFPPRSDSATPNSSTNSNHSNNSNHSLNSTDFSKKESSSNLNGMRQPTISESSAVDKTSKTGKLASKNSASQNTTPKSSGFQNTGSQSFAIRGSAPNSFESNGSSSNNLSSNNLRSSSLSSNGLGSNSSDSNTSGSKSSAIKSGFSTLSEPDSVLLRLSDHSSRAEKMTRLGILRLFCLNYRRDLRTQAQWFPQEDRLRLLSQTIPNFDFRLAVAELIGARALDLETFAIPRDEGDFNRLMQLGKTRIGWAVQELIRWFPSFLENYHLAKRSLEEHKNIRFAEISQDIREQTIRLLTPGFYLTTPWKWLREYPRYFKAIPMRFDKFKSGGEPQDREFRQILQSYQTQHDEQLVFNEASGIVDFALETFRWMLEEYRVSLFAQKLGTSIKISPVRLEKQWASLQR